VRETADIIIAGAGIIGLNVALQLARRTKAKITVLEKGSSLGEGSTGASSAVCRFHYSRDEMVELARDGIAAYQNWSDYLQLSKPLAAYHREGVLWLGGERSDAARDARRLRRFGIAAEALSAREVVARYPAVNPCIEPVDLLTGEDHGCREGGNHLLEVDGGYVDPMDALADLAAAVRAKEVEIRLNSAVRAIDVRRNKVAGVTLNDGSSIVCKTLVNAAGPWSNALFRMAGMDARWPLRPTRIQIVHVDRGPEVPGHVPITADGINGIYWRTQNRGQQIIVGSILEEDEREEVSDPDHFARYGDDDFAASKLHALQHRIPALNLKNVRGYSGLYTINRTDVHPVVGKTPVEGFYAANGFSGHGFKIAPAIGSLIGQAITGRATNFDTAVSPAFLAFDRHPIVLESLSVLA
jgi:glycine/D-amino acid oxidase-like deaminating enzyme